MSRPQTLLAERKEIKELFDRVERIEAWLNDVFERPTFDHLSGEVAKNAKGGFEIDPPSQLDRIEEMLKTLVARGVQL